MPDAPPLGEIASQQIATAVYAAERLHPQPGQELYLHLSDLRLALETVRTDARIALLDYGCGGSPYAALFPNAEYRRADYLSTGHLDYVLESDSRVLERDGIFDLVLSTQVLEHVQQPEIYLSECHRLLKPGGQLILTTHGVYIDHGCPYDYLRWTADGLRLTLEKSGFQVTTVRKLTNGPRALFFLLGTSTRWLYAPQHTLFGIFLRFLRGILRRASRWVHCSCDRFFASHRQVELDAATNGSLYVALFSVSRKAGGSPSTAAPLPVPPVA